jgi:hypothetical protein
MSSQNYVSSEADEEMQENLETLYVNLNLTKNVKSVTETV